MTDQTDSAPDRDQLGELVRSVWVRWAREQPDAKPGWLVPYAELDARYKEVDRQIGEAVFRMAEKWSNRHGELARYKQWVADLHSGMYINCVYCGHRYGPHAEVLATMAETLKHHVEECPEHPLSKTRKLFFEFLDEVEDKATNNRAKATLDHLSELACKMRTELKGEST